MAIRLLPLHEVPRPAFERLLAEAWAQSWGPCQAAELVRWRYYERTTPGDTLVAMDGDDGVAMLDSYRRSYLLDGQPIVVREAGDWFCLPPYRARGVGLQPIRRMMTYPEPMLSIGGTQATLSLLPALRWKPVGEVAKLVLPLKARGLAAEMLRRWRPDREALARAVPAFLPLRRARRAAPPAEGQVVEWQPGMPIPAPARGTPGLVSLIEDGDLGWMRRMPDWMARPMGLVFMLSGQPVGFSLSQIEPTVGGLDACLVHLQLSTEARPIAAWVVAETVARLAGAGVGMVRCLASAPAKVAALEAAGFARTRPRPAFWWHRDGAPAPASLDAGYLRADDALPLAALRGRHLGAPAGRGIDQAALGTR